MISYMIAYITCYIPQCQETGLHKKRYRAVPVCIVLPAVPLSVPATVSTPVRAVKHPFSEDHPLPSPDVRNPFPLLLPALYPAYVLRKMPGQMCKRAGLGNEPRKVFDEIAQIKAVDIALPTRYTTIIRKRCIAQPTKPQAVLLQMLGLHLPKRMKICKNVV